MNSKTPVVVDTDVVPFLFKAHSLAPAHTQRFDKLALQRRAANLGRSRLSGGQSRRGQNCPSKSQTDPLPRFVKVALKRLQHSCSQASPEA
jgi:hypothetical protein